MTEMNDAKISMASDFIKQCLLPEFDREIGDQPLERDDFNVFVYGLSQNLRLLFDMIAKNDKLLLTSTDETKEFRMHFVLLLNEQSGSWNAPFQTDDLSLVKHLETLIDQYYERVLADKGVLERCSAFYKERLTAIKWKRNIGAVYGYGRFCEVCSFAMCSHIFGQSLKNTFFLFHSSCTMRNCDRKSMWTEQCSRCRLACSSLNISNHNISISA